MIALSDISKSYRIGLSNHDALDRVTLSFVNVGFVLINGPSGCGKSTLLNIIGQLDTPTSGSVHIDGNDLTRLSTQADSFIKRQYFGYLFQHFHLLEGFTAFENVLISLLLNDVDEAQALVKCDQMFDMFNLNHLKNQLVETLSGGEAQRVAILRAIAKSPHVILADEPTGALDNDSCHKVLETLKALSNEKLVIVVSHDIEATSQYADRIIKLVNGRIVEDAMITDNKNPIPKIKFRKTKCNRLKLVRKRILRLSKHHFFWAIAALSFSITTTLLTIGLTIGANQAIKYHPLRGGASNIVYVSRLDKTLIANSPLTLLRYHRPTHSEVYAMLDGYGEAFVDVSVRAIFSHRYRLTVNDYLLENIRFEPYFDQTNPDDLSKVLINHQAWQLIENSNAIDSPLTYDVNIPINTTDIHGQVASDRFEFHITLDTSNIIEDVRFQSLPTIFYSHLAAKNLLSDYVLENAASLLRIDYSLADRLESALANDEIGNYEMMFVFLEVGEVVRFYETWDQDDAMTCSGTYFGERDYLASIMNTIKIGLYFFVSINGLSGLLTMIISLVHFYKMHRRRLAILWALGITRSQMIIMWRNISRYLTMMSLTLGMVMAPIIQLIVNQVIFLKVKIVQLIRVPFLSFLNIPAGLVILLFLIMMFIADSGALISSKVLCTDNLAEELRDDD
ncbi:MAG TPA: ABC transporter ATP-binding protein [Bacilli bacterium]|mgnify:CR=1 FL=1|nr:ABC transporter ATP-binding protein [Bacilli bacterium]